MTKIEKILVGLVVTFVAATVGLAYLAVYSTHTQSNLGGTEKAPTYISGDATRMNDTEMYGDLEVSGSSYFNTSTFYKLVKTSGRMLEGGAITSKTASTTNASQNTITASNVCDSAQIALTQGNSTTIIWTLPSTTTLFAACLSATGTVSVMLYNPETVTTTVIAAGTGGTLDYSSTSTLGALKQARATFVRVSATAYKVHLDI